ncbi:MAG: O-methyltransferase [Flavobacteriales bacterium]|nr:O-methyltransferase [Flavobacteriales bacterium]MDG2245205.1 O-methyltransferase [Flavobacteriales bacterium]
MEFLPESIDRYSCDHTEVEPQVLQELHRETWQKVIMPRMLSGHLQGRFLSFLSKLIRPNRILEIGTFTGYSAICFAEGLSANGTIETIEVNEELNTIQDKYWAKAGITSQVIRHNGSALSVLPTLKEGFDMAFIDADKENYGKYYELTLPLMRQGGVILLDNVLWSGKVVDDVKGNDPETRVLKELNAFIQKDDRVSNMLIPLRDGVMAAVKN